MSLTKAAGPFLSAAFSSGLAISCLSLWQNFASIGNTKQLFDVVKKRKKALPWLSAVYVLSDKEVVLIFSFTYCSEMVICDIYLYTWWLSQKLKNVKPEYLMTFSVVINLPRGY